MKIAITLGATCEDPAIFFNLLIWEKSNTLLHPKTILGSTKGKFFKSPSFSSYHQ